MSLQAAQPSLILASQSTARAELLRAAGVSFELAAAHIDEAEIKQGAQAEGLSAEETTILLADMKTRRIARRNPETLVIGCDQLLVCDGAWLGKPADLGVARQQLLRLRGREHMLVTAVLCRIGEQRIWHHVAKPRLTMRAFSDAFLDEYLALEDMALLGCVGAYRLEGMGMHLFDKIDGAQAAVLGLPLLELLGFLRQRGVVLG
jgi:septum formation protein